MFAIFLSLTATSAAHFSLSHFLSRQVGGFAFLAIFLGAVGSSTESTSEETPTPLYNFTYTPQADDMRYASCQISNIRGGFGSNATMADYIYMAGAAYLVEPQKALDNWFGEGVATDEEEIVTNFRAAEDEANSAVFFKLFTFQAQGLAIISIRGTTTSWDMLADAQLWAAAALMQGVRVILPIGEIWTPIFSRESGRRTCITVAFCRYLQLIIDFLFSL